MRRTRSMGTRFLLQKGPHRISSGMYTGCIEVHLGNFSHKPGGYRDCYGESQPGGAGFVILGEVRQINEWSRIHGLKCLVRGHENVLKVVGFYDTCESMCLILKDTGRHFGRQGEVYDRYSFKQGKTSRQRRRYAKLAGKYRQKALARLARMVG